LNIHFSVITQRQILLTFSSHQRNVHRFRVSDANPARKLRKLLPAPCHPCAMLSGTFESDGSSVFPPADLAPPCANSYCTRSAQR
jgi:hypothetical protein